MQRRIVAVVALVVALAGCGGDEPSAADYATEGNAACATAAEQAQGVSRPTADSADAVAAYAEGVLPIAKRRLAAFRELDPPDDLRRFHDRLVVEQERFVAAIETVAEAARRNDRATAAQASQEGASASGRSQLLYRRLGLTRCAASPF